MPAISRPNRQPHLRLKQLRKYCDNMTQAELALKAGTSFATIVAVETGTLQMSQKLARQIMIVTGVDPNSLLKGPKLMSVVPNLSFDELVYKDYISARATSKPGEPVTIKERGGIVIRDPSLRKEVERLRDEIETLAAMTIKSNQYHVFRYLWRMWTNETYNALGLLPAGEAIAKEHDLPFNVSIERREEFRQRRQGRSGSGRK